MGMPDQFDYFVLFAEMRTGSNFLEANLNTLQDVRCHGEAFNPHFIAYPNRSEVLGVTQAMRDADPARLISAIRDEPGVLGGFRYFHDHDPRILETVLADPRCAKIVLTRNPLESYVSWKIAKETGQWKLTDVKRRKDAKAKFDGKEFTRHVESLQRFQVEILNKLQVSGQTAFYLAYEDLQSIEAMNGLAKWLGVNGRLDNLDHSLKPQNPSSVSTKVINPDEMAAAVSGLDLFNLTQTPNFEPRRGPSVPTYIATASSGLLYMPVQGGPETHVSRWLAALDNVAVDDLLTGMNQKQLRQWKRKHPGHRSFTVVQHPLTRAHNVFCRKILSTAPGNLPQIRETLRQKFKLKIPKGEVNQNYSLAQHRQAFEAFLEFVRASIAGQTAIRADSTWCTQASSLAGFSHFSVPDFVLRELELPKMLPILANLVGKDSPEFSNPDETEAPYQLGELYDEQLEKLVADVYRRDYIMFGFQPWKPVQAA